MNTHIETTLRGKIHRVIHLFWKITHAVDFRVQQHLARMHTSYRGMSGEEIAKSFREGVCASSEADSMPLPKIQS